MTTAWTLTAGEICTDALEHLGIIADGETASSGDMLIALRALDGVLKELPLHGYNWPALSAEVDVAFGGPQEFALPDDYFGFPVVWKIDGTSKVRLTQIPHGKWIDMPDREVTGSAVTHFYISPLNEFWMWPVVVNAPELLIQYQRIVSDASSATSPEIPQYWINPLGYGVANELALKFSIPQDKRMEIAQRWGAKRDRALEFSIGSEAISFEVLE